MAKDNDLKKIFREGHKKIKKVQPKANSWAKNVLQSMGYSAMEVFEELTPNIANMASTGAQTAQKIVEDLKNNKPESKSVGKSLEDNVYYGIGKDWFKNALDDLKSGNLYNKKRYDETAEAMFDDFDIGGDDDFDFGDDSDDFDLGGDEDFFDDNITSSDDGASASFVTKSKNGATITQVSMINNIGPDSPIVKATENQTEVLIRSSEIANETTIASVQALLSANSKLGSDLTGLLTTINQSVSDTNENVSKIISEHYAVASQFYSDNMDIHKSILEEIKKIGEFTKPAESDSTLKKQRESKDALDMFSNGLMDVKAYGDFVKKNITSMLESNLVTSTILGAVKDTDTLKSLAANPLSFIPKSIISGMIAPKVKASLANIDKTLGEFLVTGLTQLGSLKDNYDHPIGRLLGNILGIRNESRSVVNKSNYEKGSVPWDGIARRALVDVIPMYLSQISAALTGKEQVVFDYEKGTYTSLRAIKKDREESIKAMKLSPFFDDINQFNDMVDEKFTGKSRAEIQELKEAFKNTILNMVNNGGLFNYRNFGKGEDDFADLVPNHYTGDPTVEIIRGFIEGRQRSGDKAANMRMFGRSVQEARANVTRSTEYAEKDPIGSNMQYIDNGLDRFDNPHLKFYKNGTFVNKGIGGGGGTDKYGKSSVQYLRSILGILNRGILVEVTNFPLINNNEQSTNSLGYSIKEKAKKTGLELNDETDNFTKLEYSRNNIFDSENSHYDSDIEKGKINVKDDISEQGSNLISTEYHNERIFKSDKEDFKIDKRSGLAKFADHLPEGTKNLLYSLDERLRKSGSIIASGIDRVNSYLYEILFGREGDSRNFATMLMDKFIEFFDQGKSWVFDHILNPMDKALFGEDGFFTRLKNSQIAEDFKNLFTGARDTIFGTKVTDSDGNTKFEGGILSEVATEFKNIGENLKTTIFGDKDVSPEDDNSIFGNIKRVGSNITNTIGVSLGIKEDNLTVTESLSSKLASATNDIYTDIKARASEWSTMIFGPKSDDEDSENYVRKAMDSFSSDMKDSTGAIGAGVVIGGASAAILGSHVGLLSSIFLPGGPIGGALLGAGIAIVNKSETLKTALFGDKDEEGNRTGGFITKEFTDFFKDNKGGLITGGIAGLAASTGILPALFVPGGPIGGAIIGGSLSLATKTEAFQEFLYGEGGTKDDPTGGITKKIKDAFGKEKDLKKLAIDAGVGAGVGLVGSFFLPGGPIIGALVGAAVNIGLNTEKFKTFMFGDETFDENGDSLGREGGLFGKVTSFVERKIFEPLAKTAQEAQIKMIGFVEQKMVAPLLSAISPITNKFEEIGLNLKDGVSGFFSSIGNKFNETVIDPIGEMLEPFVDKMKNILGRIFGGLFKAVGAVISSPFQMVGAIGRSIFEQDAERGAKAMKEDTLQSIFDHKGRKERGEKMGLFSTTTVDEDGNKVKTDRGLLGRLIYANSKKAKIEGAFSEKGAGKYASIDKNPFSIERDFIAKSKAKQEERLARLRGENIDGDEAINPISKFKAWLDGKKTPGVEASVLDKYGDSKAVFREIFVSLLDAGYEPEDAARMAIEISGIDVTDPDSFIKKFLKKERKDKKKLKDRNKDSKDNDDDTKLKLEDIPAISITDEISKQTDISTEQHKESIGIFSAIKDKLDSLFESIKKEKDPLDIDKGELTKNLPKVDVENESRSKSKIKDEEETGLKKKEKKSLIDNVDKIADSVYGQLNGLGLNVNKIYKLLLKMTNHTDDEITGENNKQYVGFFGKIRTALNRPIKAATDFILTPFRFIGEKLNGIGKMIGGIGHAFGTAAKEAWAGTKALASGIKDAALSLLGLPVELAKMAGTILANALPVAKEVLVGGVKAISTGLVEGLKIGGAVLVEGVKTVGAVIQEGARGFGELVGGALSGLGHLLAGLGLVGKEVLSGLVAGTKGLFKFGAFMIKGAFKAGAGIIGSLFSKKDGEGGIFGKRMTVYVDGGFLDLVKLIEKDDPACQDRTIDNFNIQTNEIIDQLKILTGGDKRKKRNVTMERFGNIPFNNIIDGFAEDITDNDSPLKRFKEEKEYRDRVDKGSAKSQREEYEEEDEKDAEEKRHSNLMDALKGIGDTTKEQHKSWTDVFGLKKGILTLGLLMLAPKILKLLPSIKDMIGGIFNTVGAIGSSIGSLISDLPKLFKDNGGVKGFSNNSKELFNNVQQLATGRKSQTVINDDGTVGLEYDEDGEIKGVKKESVNTGLLLGRANNFLMPSRAKVDIETGEVYRERDFSTLNYSLLTNLPKKPVKKFLTNIGAQAGESMAANLFNHGDDAIKTVSKISTKSGMIGRFIDLARTALKNFSDDILAFLAKHGVATGGATKIVSLISKCASKINEKVCLPFAEKITKVLGKGVGSFLTAGMVDLAFGAVGAILTNPAKVFHVNKKDVDAKMQLISRFAAGILSTSYGSIIDILFQIIYSIFGYDVFGEICVLIYNLLSDEADKEKLKEAREKFKDTYEDFLDKEYEAYAKNARSKGQPVMERSDYMASELATSRLQYNEMENPTGFQGVINTVSHGFNWIDRKLKSGFSGLNDFISNANKSYSDKFGYGGYGDNDEKPSGSTPSMLNGLPYFSQNDPIYGNKQYNLSDGTKDTISNRGCGPTSMAMVLSGLTGKLVKPTDTAELAEKSGFSTSIGTQPEFFKFAADKFGINSAQLQTDPETIKRSLKAGRPVIIQGQNDDDSSPYTESGHYVVGTGMQGDKVLVNDPRGANKSKAYSMKEILDGSRNMWIFGNGKQKGTTAESPVITGGFADGADMMNGFPYLMQNDPRWGSKSYTSTGDSSQTIATSGCGTTSMAMIARSFGYNLTPEDTSKWSVEHGFRTANSGTSWDFFPAISKELGLNVRSVGDTSSVAQALSEGKPVISSMGPGEFTKGGHFIVLSGANDKGILVNDPAKQRDGLTYPLSLFGSQSKNFWIFDKNGKGSIGNVADVGSIQATSSTTYPASMDTSSSDSPTEEGSKKEGNSIGDILLNLATGIGDIFMKRLGFKKESTASNTFNVASNMATDNIAAAPGNAPLTGNSNEEKVWHYFRNAGHTKESTAGIMGNIYQESKFDPSMLQKGSHNAAGIFQWENYKNKTARWAELNKYAQGLGKDWTDLKSQLDFGRGEMIKDSWMWSKDWGKPTKVVSYSDFQKLNDVTQATKEFLWHFERANDDKAALPTRIAMAKQYYNTYKDLDSSNQTTNNASTSAGINVATANKEGVKPTKSSTQTANISMAGMGGFGDGKKVHPATRIKVVEEPRERIRPIKSDNDLFTKYGGFGAVKADNSKIIDLLSSINDGVTGVNNGVHSLNKKELPSGGNTQNINFIKGGTTNNVNTPKSPSKAIPFSDDMESVKSDYRVAKKIARSLAGAN